MKNTGRPQRTDGETTRLRIIETAGALFGSKGYAETTSKMIANEAEVNIASINYHFGNRDGLYRTVLLTAHDRLVSVENLQLLEQSTGSSKDKIYLVIKNLLASFGGEEHWHTRVLSRELMSPSSHIEALLQNELAPKLSIVRNIISDFTQIPLENPALTRCLFSVGAPCLMLMVAGKRAPGPFKELSKMPKEDVIHHFFNFAVAGLEAISAEYAQSTNKREK